MISDATTFFLSFAAIFVAIGIYLWVLDGRTRILEDRVVGMEVESIRRGDRKEDESEAPPEAP